MTSKKGGDFDNRRICGRCFPYDCYKFGKGGNINANVMEIAIGGKSIVHDEP